MRFGEVDPGDENDPAKFEPPLQLDFKRARLDLHIIEKESDPSSKYELFERLNTGGSRASDQEVRNCVLVWMNTGGPGAVLRVCAVDGAPRTAAVPNGTVVAVLGVFAAR